MRTPRAAPVPPLATPRQTALRRGEGGRWPTRRAAPTHARPQGRRRRHPSSSGATARRGRPDAGEAYPKGRPYRQKGDPAPPEIGRGSKRALTHRAGKSNRLMCDVRQGLAGAKPPRLPPRREGRPHPPSGQGRLSSGPDVRVGQSRVDSRHYRDPPYNQPRELALSSESPKLDSTGLRRQEGGARQTRRSR